ncbi:hypothetical protein SKP52_00715 [Sphingopyxis fribergensis]|uniref:Uncharacterized protein n=1 Tax=Sphingopyxis fribergensis TaxID=1515612 RepID=A0A0A7PAS4_9SPHN|nr:hypothetical protein SKP52_00715 [Sphingopyxis fribergensis]
MLCASMIDLLIRRNRARLSPEEEDEPIRRHAKRVSPDRPARREQEGSASARPQTPSAASSSGDSASSASATSMSRRMEAGRSRCAAPVAPALERTACHCSVGGCSPSSDRRAARMSSIGTGAGAGRFANGWLPSDGGSVRRPGCQDRALDLRLQCRVLGNVEWMQIAGNGLRHDCASFRFRSPQAYGRNVRRRWIWKCFVRLQEATAADLISQFHCRSTCVNDANQSA